MKAIQTGNIYEIYDDSMNTYDGLPAQSYVVDFSKERGFFLRKYSDIKIKEKIYGVSHEKVNKVLDSFDNFNRSLGVILSGDKGIGKSLFAKALSKEAIESRGLPLIIVNKYIPGIANFLDGIEQEVVILFDEFDKIFAETNDYDPQAEMLTLFDGVSQGKKLFVVTCNELRGLNDFLVNRPGRFHYHFRFEYPSDTEIAEYLEDKIDSAYYNEIGKVISFAKKVDINYDCLRAIAFELQKGESFEEAIKDLNILRIEREVYNLTIYFNDGTSVKLYNRSFDIFSDEEVITSYEDDGYYDCFDIRFYPTDIKYDFNRGGNVIEGADITYTVNENLNDEDNEHCFNLWNKYNNTKIVYMSVKKVGDKKLHYAL